MAQQENAGVVDSLTCSVDEFIRTSFDYLICGGGSAGCAIAARLSENPDVTVGVIEAGKCRIGDPLVDTPAALFQLLEDPEYDWCMYTAPQKENHGKVHNIPRGKLLGGSSGINYMLYARGSRQDFNDWAELVQDEGWSADAMQHYMRKHQTLEPLDPAVEHEPTMPFVGELHGTSGPIRTSFNDSVLPVENDIIKACDEVAGISKKPIDPWSGDHIGFYHTLATIRRTGPNRGKRSYAAREYLKGDQAQSNLKILCESLVHRVILDGTKATGISFLHKGKEYQVSPRREIIVCAGPLKSPQILELSGIGDPAVLEAANVRCKIENPAIGANLQDHPLTIAMFELQPNVVSSDTLYQVPEAMQDAQKQYSETNGGPLSCTATVQGFFPIKTVLSEAELEAVIQSIRDTKPISSFHEKQLTQVIAHLQSDISANMQMVLIPTKANIDGIQHQRYLFPPPAEGEPAGVTLALCLQFPVARGYVHIGSADPNKAPVIQPNYAGHEADRAVIGAALRWAENVGQSQHLQSSFARRSFPEPSINLQNLDNAKAAVHDVVLGEYHICGSVAMGDALDSRLRVKGVEGLRVADASVFPNNVSGNIISSVYAIAEKAADMIKEDWASARRDKKL